jgi:hypothetical protein
MSKSDSLSNLPHYVKVKPNIVVGRQDRRGDLSCGKKMPEISARVPLTYPATAVYVDRPLVFYVPGILDQHASFARVQARVPRRSRWQHAIHHVDSPRDIIRQLFRPPDSHEVTRPLFGQ